MKYYSGPVKLCNETYPMAKEEVILVCSETYTNYKTTATAQLGDAFITMCLKKPQYCLSLTLQVCYCNISKIIDPQHLNTVGLIFKDRGLKYIEIPICI